MISWDIVMMLGQAFLTLFLLPTALAFDVYAKRVKNVISGVTTLSVGLKRKRGVYVPRLTSGSTTIGLSVITLALFNLGAPIGGCAAALCVMLWGVVFVFRGTAPVMSWRGEDDGPKEQNEIPLEVLLQPEDGGTV